MSQLLISEITNKHNELQPTILSAVKSLVRLKIKNYNDVLLASDDYKNRKSELLNEDPILIALNYAMSCVNNSNDKSKDIKNISDSLKCRINELLTNKLNEEFEIINTDLFGWDDHLNTSRLTAKIATTTVGESEEIIESLANWYLNISHIVLD